MSGTSRTRSRSSQQRWHWAQQLLSGPRRHYLEASAIFMAAMACLLTLAPSAPFAKELGVCESGAVRDVLAGNVILPRFLPGPIVHVPPLYWWTAALCVKAIGWNELALRMPSLLAAALTCAIVFGWTAGSLGRLAAWWSAAALLCCHFFLDAARQPRMDSMLALFVTLAVTALARVIARRKTGQYPVPIAAEAERFSTPSSPSQCHDYSLPVDTAQPSQPRRSGLAGWSLALAAASIGLGGLTKGILGIVLPALVIGLYLLVNGRIRELFSFKLVVTFAAGLAMGLTWFAAGYGLGGRPFVEWQVRMNLWSRFLPTGAGGAGYCAHPFWYFAPKILSGFLPWSLYLPAFMASAWPERGRRIPQPIVYTLCWFAAIFLFFSASQGKCLVYILPAFPPLAILVGWTIAGGQIGGRTPDQVGGAEGRAYHELGSERGAAGCVVQNVSLSNVTEHQRDEAGTRRDVALSRNRRRQRFDLLMSGASVVVAMVATVILAGAAALIIGGVPAKIPLRLHSTDRRFIGIFGGLAVPLAPTVLIWLTAWGAGIYLLVSGLMRRIAARHLLGTLVIAAAGSWFWFAVMNPALAARESLKSFAEAAAIIPADARVGHFGLGDCELNFYSPRPLEPVLRPGCGQSDYLVIRQSDFDAISPARRACFSLVLRAYPDDSIGPRLLLKQQRRPCC
jgi:Dolichyl-phosphate-mannose-protein mannosyltransferase